MKNELIISEFEKLLKQINYDIDNEKDKIKRNINIFRLKQITNALDIIKNFPNEIKSGSQLKEIKGIGKGVIGRIDEILKKGFLAEIKIKLADVKEAEYIENLKDIYGIGEKTAHELVSKYKIHTVNELKSAYKKGKIELNNNIIIGLKYHNIYEQKIPREEMEKMAKYVQNIASQVSKKLCVRICGSFRREKPFSNDIDCMLTHPNIKTIADIKNKKNYLQKFIEALRDDLFIVDALTSDEVETKFMGFCQFSKKLPVRRIDIRYIPNESYYPALLYFTGSGSFNQKMRQHAKKLGFKLSEYGLYKIVGNGYKNIPVKSEEDIFKKLNMNYVEPKNRL